MGPLPDIFPVGEELILTYLLFLHILFANAFGLHFQCLHNEAIVDAGSILHRDTAEAGVLYMKAFGHSVAAMTLAFGTICVTMYCHQ